MKAGYAVCPYCGMASLAKVSMKREWIKCPRCTRLYQTKRSKLLEEPPEEKRQESRAAPLVDGNTFYL